jgi:hypothetical protein
MTVSRIDICPGPYEEGYVLQCAVTTLLMQRRAPVQLITSDDSTGVAAHREEQILQHVDAWRQLNQRASPHCIRWPPTSLIQKADDEKPIMHNSTINDFFLEQVWKEVTACSEQYIQNLSSITTVHHISRSRRQVHRVRDYLSSWLPTCSSLPFLAALMTLLRKKSESKLPSVPNSSTSCTVPHTHTHKGETHHIHTQLSMVHLFPRAI